MSQVRRTEVDGVRCLWVETGRPTLAARLVFRFGTVDEPFLESGWQHLLEHLALEGRGGGALQVNGSIGLLETAFDAHGPADAVLAHLDALTAWLSAPMLDRLDHEAKVLRSEARLRAGDPAVEALTWRYGAAGPGLVGHHGPAVGRASAASLTARARRVLTRGNAVLVLDGPPPPGLRLHLPDGDPVAVPTAVPVVPARPAAYVSESGLTVSGVVPRSVAIRIAHPLLSLALRDELRTGAGAAYAPWAVYEPVDTERGVVVGGSDVGPELTSTVVNRTLQLVRGLRARRPDPERLDDVRAAYLQGLSDPFHAFGHALGHAQALLTGVAPRSAAELADQARAVTGTEVRDAFEHLHSTLLLGVPPSAIWDDPLPVVRPAPSTTVVRGRARRNVDWPANRTRLRVDASGLALTAGRDERTVPLDTLAGVLVWDDGLRQVVQRDGFAVVVDPQDWHGGHRAVARLDEVVPEELRLPQPPIERPPTARVGWLRRWTWPLTRRLRRPHPLTVVAVLIVVGGLTLGALMVGTGRTDGLGGVVLLTSLSLWAVGKVADP